MIDYENEKVENKTAQPTENWTFAHKTSDGQKQNHYYKLHAFLFILT